MRDLKSLDPFTSNSRGVLLLIVLILNGIIVVRDLALMGYYSLIYAWYYSWISLLPFVFLDLLMLLFIAIYIRAPRLSNTFDGLKKLYLFSAFVKLVLDFVYVEITTGFRFFLYLEYIEHYFDIFAGFILSLVLLVLTFLVLIPMLEIWMHEETKTVKFPNETSSQFPKTDHIDTKLRETDVAKNNICPECESKIPPNSKYCPFCGRQF